MTYYGPFTQCTSKLIKQEVGHGSAWSLTGLRRDVVFQGVVLLMFGECCSLWWADVSASGEVWQMYNADTQCTLEGRGQRAQKIVSCLNFSYFAIKYGFYFTEASCMVFWRRGWESDNPAVKLVLWLTECKKTGGDTSCPSALSTCVGVMCVKSPGECLENSQCSAC